MTNTKQLPVHVARDLSNLINQMLLGRETLERANARDLSVPYNLQDQQYWYEYTLSAEKQLQAWGIHLAAPLE
jgi:hypothetical protein